MTCAAIRLHFPSSFERLAMFTSYPRFTRVLTLAVLTAGFAASAHARPTDLSWTPGVVAAAPSAAQTPQRNLGAPYQGPRGTIPSVIESAAPPLATQAEKATRWVGPRNTVPVLR